LFRRHRPQAILAMGGFTSAPPIQAGKISGAATFLHEANSIPGRANRLLSPFVDQIFVGFPGAAARLHSQNVAATGTPVRNQFSPADSASCRMALGLRADQPVLLVVGGSQGATGINRLMAEAAPMFKSALPDLQFLHLTGGADRNLVQQAYAAAGCRATVLPFLSEMELALGAATVAISRAGASAIAEFAAMQVPAILIPYPAAADNHQYFNARAVVESGAALQFEQRSLTAHQLAQAALDLISKPSQLEKMRSAWQAWQFPNAAEDIANRILVTLGMPQPENGNRSSVSSDDFRRIPPSERNALRSQVSAGLIAKTP
jgi:UDP-N-acetylglucosamine--N-acetylmuramyl-(pentapeptide) pyrophosphoryl-undecaprenol N-acetylglucosamine transferase